MAVAGRGRWAGRGQKLVGGKPAGRFIKLFVYDHVPLLLPCVTYLCYCHASRTSAIAMSHAPLLLS